MLTRKRWKQSEHIMKHMQNFTTCTNRRNMLETVATNTKLKCDSNTTTQTRPDTTIHSGISNDRRHCDSLCFRLSVYSYVIVISSPLFSFSVGVLVKCALMLLVSLKLELALQQHCVLCGACSRISLTQFMLHQVLILCNCVVPQYKFND